MGKIAYITAKTPFGNGETFILTEITALKELKTDLVIIPRDKSDEILLEKAKPLIKYTLNIPYFNGHIIMELFKYLLKEPILFFKIINDIACKARNVKIALKNLLIFPKSLYLSTILKQNSICHIHSHWGSTTATVAYVINKITNIPWSFTLHRFDIPENNILRSKCKAASFVRAIDEKGKEETIAIIKDNSLSKKISVIHMGVFLPVIKENIVTNTKYFTILCPASFEYRKGHKYLFEACRLLIDKGIKIKCLLAGDGHLEGELKKMVNKLNLNNYIEFLGRVLHEDLFKLYESQKVSAVVLPSIVTEDNRKEGIPVALMEAMSYGIPVISTDIGGIYELIGDGSGIMVDENNSEAIANGIEKLIIDEAYYNKLSKIGREKVERDFNVYNISEILINKFSKYSN